MKKLILTVSLGIVCTFYSEAQNDIDAMRYSQLTFGGTARFGGMAGSMSALGGDISTLSFNPAGVGVFRKTELSVSPSLFSQSTTSTYNGISSKDTKLNVNLGNIGLVAAIPLKSDKNGGWEYFNFAIGYNRTNNFNNRISIKGDNKTSSLLDTYVAAANGTDPSMFDGFSTNLAYQAYLINPVSITDTSHYNHVIAHYGETQKKSVTSSGSMGETVINAGTNYKSKLFLGATIGIVNVKYVETSQYQEEDTRDTIAGFKSFSFNQNLTTQGNGFNFKLGAIVKPLDWLNIGLAVHSPTVLNLKDAYSSSMFSDLDNTRDTSTTYSPKGSFNYKVTTPFRALASLGFIINKMALINVEYEYVDYSYAHLSSSPMVFTDVNAAILSKYTSTGNLRAGAEIRFDPFAVRLGYALYGSPFKDGENKNANRSSYTTGVGYRYKHFFMDLAFVYTTFSEYNYLYDSPSLNAVKSKYSSSSFMTTVGVKF